MRQRHLRIWLILFGALMLGVILACGTGGIAIRQGVVKPPDINLTVRGIGVVAHTTNVPSCVVWFLPCQVTALGPAREMYAIWVVWKPVESPGDIPGARRIFAMKLEP